MKALLHKLRRQLEFARHISPRKIGRRAQLILQRHFSARLRPSVNHAFFSRSSLPLLPLFPRRSGMATRTKLGWRFTFLGRSLAMQGDIDWHAFGTAPAEQLWRMNLHYMEFLEELHANDAAAAILSWIDSNPPFRPGCWRDSWSSYALSLRTVVWMQQFDRVAEMMPPENHAVVLRSLAQQLAFLETTLETDLGGNHLIKNVKALLWASVFFSGPGALRWRKLGLKLLRGELRTQILPDGMHYERSPSYHAQVFADLLEIRHALGADPPAEQLEATLTAMARPLVDLTHPDGGPALFNDAGLSMAYSPAECLHALAAVTGRITPRPNPVFAYSEAGYFGLRTPALYLVADMGRIGPDDLPAHAHGDLGSFELSVAGRRLIVDQGVFEYVEGAKRTLSRATSAHNTLALEEADQAEFFGSFRCGRRPNVTVRAWEPREEALILEGSHDGWSHLPGHPVAVRRIEADAQRVRISDWIEGLAGRVASVSLLLHPEAELTEAGNDLLVARGDASIRISASGTFAIEPAVYWPDMGQEQPTKRLRMRLSDPPARSEFVIEIAAG